jgi:hypothetical protein
MKKFRKLIVTVAALAALAVGGAAFAQAQNAATAPTAPTLRNVAEEASSGDVDGTKAGEREGADSASEIDAPEGPRDQADGPGADRETNDD